MNAIVFTLEEKLAAQVAECSAYLVQHFDGVKPTEPHCSIHICEQYELPVVKNYLTQLAPQISPCLVPITGLGQFFMSPEQRAVLYLSVVRTPKLAQLNELLYETLSNVTTDYHPLYRPFTWMPHITFGNVPLAQLPAAVGYLTQFSWQQETLLSKLAIMVETEETVVKQFEVAVG